MLNEGGLYDEDEGAYAGFALAMNETGNYTIPDFPWSLEHRKTPLHFWVSALSFKVLGENEFALRFPAVLSIVLTIFSLYWFGRKAGGNDNALAGALVLASSFLLPNFGKIALTDHLLLLCSTWAMLGLWNFLNAPSWKWNLLMWAGVSLGLLTKGPPILILFGGVWVFCALFHPQRKRLIGTHPWLFLPLALAPLAAWVYATTVQDGGVFAHFLWDWYVAKRVGGSVFGQSGFAGYHLVVLVISFLPWFTFFPSSLANLVSNVRQRHADDIFLLGWILFGWIFYELMASKLPSYSMAVQPAIAFLIGRQALYSERKDYKYFTWDRASVVLFLFAMFALSMLILVAAYQLLFPVVASSGMLRAIPAAMVGWVASFIAVVGVYLHDDIRHKVASASMAVAGVGMVFLLWLSVMPLVEASPLKATKHAAWTAKKSVNSQTEGMVWCNDHTNRQPSLAFYTASLFNGLKSIPKDKSAVIARFQSNIPVVLITDESFRNELSDSLKTAGKTFTFEEKVPWWDTDGQLKTKYFYVVKN